MRAGEIFCIPSSFLFLPLGASYILLVCFGLAFERLFLFLYIKFSVHLPIKKIILSCDIIEYFLLN